MTPARHPTKLLHVDSSRSQNDTAPASAQWLQPSRLWNYAPWINRAILALPLVLFFLIGSKYLATPNQVATASGMALNSPTAVTDMRVEGAVFFALAALTLFSLSTCGGSLPGSALLRRLPDSSARCVSSAITLTGRPPKRASSSSLK